MKIHKVIDNKKLVEQIISNYGYAPEHNYWYFVNMQSDSSVCLLFEDDGKALVFLKHNDLDFEVISEILSPKDEQVGFFIKFLDYIYKNYEVDDVLINVHNGFKTELENKVGNKYNIKNPRRIFHCPVFNMEDWDPSLPGKEWKKHRNMRNNFLSNNKSRIIDFNAKTNIDKEELLNLVDEWCCLSRSMVKKEWGTCFKNFIMNGFKGCDIARIIIVDGKPCSITAGWKIPNTNNYYSAIGVHNYRYPYLGEVAYLDDFANIGKLGVKYADLGGSDSKQMLAFKMKFKPESLYTTYFISVSKIREKDA